jgi:two-component system, LytTR family, sensor kinase
MSNQEVGISEKPTREAGSTYNAFRNIEWIADDKYRLALHLIFWLVVYMDKLLAVAGLGDIPYITPWSIIYYFMIDAGLIYFNLYVLIPAFLLSNRVYLYLGITVATLLINVELHYLLTVEVFCADCLIIHEEGAAIMLITNFASSAFILGTAIGANIMRRFIKSQILIRKLEVEKLETELNFLKSQINPHFLFNSLNNIYVQIRKNVTDAGDSVLQLSDLLRYQLYDCSKDRVNLKDEIEYLKNYLRLDKIRKTETDIQMEVEGDPSEVLVAPYLFIPFVENAIVHGVAPDEPSRIAVRFIITEEKLKFAVENTIPDKPVEKEKGGIGLKNVKRRLDLLYPGKYSLDIHEENRSFFVSLTLDFKTGENEMYNSG